MKDRLPSPVMRTISFGEDRTLSLIEKMNIRVTTRIIRRLLPSNREIAALDLGCGFNAHYLLELYPLLASGTGVYIKVSEALRKNPKLNFIESTIEAALPGLPDACYDLVLCVGILEHVWDPLPMLRECRRVMRSGGVLLIIVPTWTARPILEWLARSGWIDVTEIDDHKMYYSKRDLWPLARHAGFLPSAIRLQYRKAGLVVVGTCRA